MMRTLALLLALAAPDAQAESPILNREIVRVTPIGEDRYVFESRAGFSIRARAAPAAITGFFATTPATSQVSRCLFIPSPGAGWDLVECGAADLY